MDKNIKNENDSIIYEYVAGVVLYNVHLHEWYIYIVFYVCLMMNLFLLLLSATILQQGLKQILVYQNNAKKWV